MNGPQPIPLQGPPGPWPLWTAGARALCMALVCALACWKMAGPTLGLLLGSTAFAALLTPALVCGESTWPGRAGAAAGVFAGIALVWLGLAFQTDTTFGQWIQCCLILLTFVAALAGLAAALQPWLGSVAAAALLTLAACAYLSWPLWLGAALHGAQGQHLCNLLVPAHPLFALNAVVARNLGNWSERSIIYVYSTMNQDVLCTLPPTIWPAVGLHTVIALAAGASAWRPRPAAAQPKKTPSNQ